jgi:DedD protein
MDSRAKQRLTGAVILVALFVLLVPELLTGPRDAGGDAPSEEGMRRYTIDLDAASGGMQPTAPPGPAPAVSLPPVAEKPALDAAAGARAAPGEAAQPDAGTSAAAAATPRAATPQAAASTSTPTAAAPEPVAAAPKAAPVAPIAHASPERAEPPRPVAPETAPRGGFAVQLGSFVSRENAERLVREMTAKGFNAFLAPPIKTGGRELYRVRVGPARDRASAEALATQLRRIGQKGSIVAIS